MLTQVKKLTIMTKIELFISRYNYEKVHERLNLWKKKKKKKNKTSKHKSVVMEKVVMKSWTRLEG